MVLGDSIVKHVKLDGVAKVHVFSGIKSSQLEKVIEKQEVIKHSNPKLIFLHVGTNDLKNSKSPEEVMGEIYSLARCVKDKYPKSKVLVNGIVKRRDVSYRYLDRVNENIRWA